MQVTGSPCGSSTEDYTKVGTQETGHHCRSPYNDTEISSGRRTIFIHQLLLYSFSLRLGEVQGETGLASGEGQKLTLVEHLVPLALSTDYLWSSTIPIVVYYSSTFQMRKLETKSLKQFTLSHTDTTSSMVPKALDKKEQKLWRSMFGS